VLGTPASSSAIIGERNPVGIAATSTQISRKQCGFWRATKGCRSAYFDHALSGEWRDFRDCHIRPDLILIYRKPDAENLELVRLGSHSELGF
jgi:hypothetical protein